MSFLSSLLGRPRDATANSQLGSAHSQHPQHSESTASETAHRRDVLRLALRETLNWHGIPVAWIGAEVLVATSRGRPAGIHWRLLVRHWEPRLLTHGVALEHSLVRRALMLDPMATDWLVGISWQFALEDESQCPPMPHPGLWTAEPHHTPPPPPVLPGGSGDVISGPVLIGTPAHAKAELERIMNERDTEFNPSGRTADAGAGDNEATEPMHLVTQPMRLP